MQRSGSSPSRLYYSSLFCECPKFCDLAKQRRKIFWGVSEVGKNDFSLYFCWRCVVFLVLYYSSAAIARRLGSGSSSVMCSWDKKVGETTESPVDGQEQPKIYEIRDHTLEVLMQPCVLELHAVRVVRTPHGDERQLNLKVRVMFGQKEVMADVLVDTGPQVSLMRNVLFPETCLKSSD